MKKFLACIFTILLCSTMLSIPNTLAATLYLDNDDPIGKTWSDGTWGYAKSSTGYRGDHRIAYGKGNEYHWNFDFPGTGKKKIYYVYLSNAAFTNTKAVYYGSNMSGTEMYTLGEINQNKAKPGWVQINSTGYTGSNYCLAVGTNGSTAGTGADGAKVEY
ncbi:hypothetical protein JFL43_03735 [Viridibacillus sp. YIM B01967]|uniref:Uncharacterized protein n=1 Tax=Viridibacillus soli TaxID=2798301 RepID=A0ABS1H4K3_9BACL|nr:hypothetical protein [Viridibacillus soli]MBK3493983.1 hypothetical protein [Viridibacillus soli]